jgi:branched-chain amino acid aminotransferase
MSKPYQITFFKNQLTTLEKTNLNVTTSAVLYGLSVYTVFHVSKGRLAFRLEDHYKRLINSAKIIGLDTFTEEWDFKKFKSALAGLVTALKIDEDMLVRVTIHADEILPGTRSRGISTVLSAFAYPADPILNPTGVRLKSSPWRRIPDYSIPSRAKVNGAYVNSVLAKQDAIDSGFDDCIFLDGNGHVCELSAANLFVVMDGKLLTPGTSSDILEGINRRTILDLAKDMNLETVERTLDLTELYIADEVFACGTSTFIASVSEIDGRKISTGPITEILRKKYLSVLHGQTKKYQSFVTDLRTIPSLEA